MDQHTTKKKKTTKNKKTDLKELDSIIHSFNFRLIGFRFIKKNPNNDNHLLIKSFKTEQVFKIDV